MNFRESDFSSVQKYNADSSLNGVENIIVPILLS